MNLCALALVLLMDVSGSVDASEYRLQRDGTAAAFRSAEVVRAVGREIGVAVIAIEWATHTAVTVPWRILRTAADTEAFAAALEATTRTQSGGTMMGTALAGAERALEGAPCVAEREVVDVSGDGISDDPVGPARAALLARGATINALVVPELPWVPAFFSDQVVGGGGFLMVAESYAAFAVAIRRKILLEIAAR